MRLLGTLAIRLCALLIVAATASQKTYADPAVDPPDAIGTTVNVGNGPQIHEMIQNVGAVLKDSALYVCIAVFILGAFFYVASAGDEQRKGYGKGMMTGSLLGAAVIFGAPHIMNFFLDLTETS